MTNQIGGQPPVPDYRRIHRATSPRLRQPTPALNYAAENANVTIAKTALTFNRAGSGPANPILSGLGLAAEFSIGLQDRLRGVWLYQDRALLGDSLKADATSVAPGDWSLPFVAGDGRTLAGTPETGAKRNFIRVQSAFGSFEREFWIKSYDADVIAINGENCLEVVTLEPVAVDVPQIASGASLVQANIDFMVSWNDEFQALHNAKNPYLDPGFLKAYGGAKFVSLFETGMGEGSGAEVVAITQQLIQDVHRIDLENTAGIKHVTARFRSKEDSPHYVDVPILLNVVPLPSCPECPEGDCACTEAIVESITAVVDTEDGSFPGTFFGVEDISSYAAAFAFGPAVDGEYRVWRLIVVETPLTLYDMNGQAIELCGGYIDADGSMHMTFVETDFLGSAIFVVFSAGNEFSIHVSGFEGEEFVFRFEKGCATWPTDIEVSPIWDGGFG